MGDAKLCVCSVSGKAADGIERLSTGMWLVSGEPWRGLFRVRNSRE